MADQGGQAAEAIRRTLAGLGRSQTWLAAEVARLEGRAEPWSQSLVSEWLSGARPIPPARMFAIEETLGVPRGSISRLDGYVPSDIRPHPSVLSALEADRAITDDQRAILVAAYEAARRVTRSRRKR